MPAPHPDPAVESAAPPGQPRAAEPPAPVAVTAVLVAHDGHRWLPRLLRALESSTRQPDRLVAVDTGSADATRDDLLAGLGEAAVHVAARRTGFGEAVAQALAAAPPIASGSDATATEWVWLLHDDCVPEPDALSQLLLLAGSAADVGAVGPKLRAWPASRRLKEVGITIARSGRRERGFDGSERDQGQRDSVHDVLAVSTAGMLVRRDVFDALGGFDPRITLFGDDLDLGWRMATLGYRVLVCPSAVVYHADAAAEGLRPMHASGRTRLRLYRGNAVYLLLANAHRWRLPFTWLRLVAGSLLRVLGLLLGKAPRAAFQEFAALVDVLVRPGRLIGGRRFRKRALTRARRAGLAREPRRLKPLLARPGTQVRRLGDAVGELAATAGTSGSAVAGGGRHRSATAFETGPVPDEAQDLITAEPGRWGRRLRRPFAVMTLVLLAVTAVATRDLWSTELAGGALWPAPAGAADLWRTYLSAWHPVEGGSAAIAPPWLAVMAALSTVAAGKPGIVVTVLLVGAVPLSAATAYLTARSLIQNPWIRAWAAGAYGLLPAVTGAVAQGRFGTCFALILTPIVLLAARRCLIGGRSVRGSWPAAFTTALLLAIVGAFVPVAWLVFVAVGLIAAVLSRSLLWLLRVVAIAVAGAAVTLPWSQRLFTQHWRWFAEPGSAWNWASAGRPQPGAAWWLHPLGFGSVQLCVAGLLVLAALAAMLRSDRGRPTLIAWLVVAAAGAAAVLERTFVVATPTGGRSPAWPGMPVALVLAALVLAAAIGADGVVARLRGRSFGWRQPSALLLAVLTGLVPLAASGWWVLRGADGPVQADQPLQVPAYIAAEMRTPRGARTLVVRAGAQRSPTYVLLRHDRYSFADLAVAPGPSASASVAAAVHALTVNQNLAAVRQLARLGIRYVYLADDTGPGGSLTQDLDATPGLARASAPAGAAVWQLTSAAGPVGPMRVYDPDSGRGSTVLAADPRDARIRVPAGSEQRVLQLAETANRHWRASLDGHRLRRVDDAGLAAFNLPAEGGVLRVWFDDPANTRWNWAQLGLLVALLVLAFPGVARDAEAAARHQKGRVA